MKNDFGSGTRDMVRPLGEKAVLAAWQAESPFMESVATSRSSFHVRNTTDQAGSPIHFSSPHLTALCLCPADILGAAAMIEATRKRLL
ncbi:hypothetical protein [Caballeronia sp. TF1N1]|uniref:hypothetical protein n=1 Tax=Caballeronia sp. TF1N1 TaxID=2878153 RepID=UPI001FD07D91|nr:hypothetical protein [Caballeronia sp. TF1N1]